MAPSLPLQLGFDPATIKPQQGVVLVAFNNTTTFSAEFLAYEIGNVRNAAGSSRNFSAVVDAGQQWNEVLDCPVARISPGTLGANLQVDSTAVTVAGAGAAAGTTVTYDGPPLDSGNAYTCGDLIEIRLSNTGSADTPTFVVSVRVIRGR
jgi:hypothetical protein